MSAPALTLTSELPVSRFTPANEGAWRLAWWLSQNDARWSTLSRHAGVTPSLIDRLLEGALIPGDELGASIARETEGVVLPADWTVPATAKWTDTPPARAAA